MHLFTVQFTTFTRYYWRKNARGIRLTKVSTIWPQINIVDAAFEVPRERTVYLFEGNVNRVFSAFNTVH